VWKEGDDQAWAAPSLDESDWHPASEWKGVATPRPFFWLRCQFEPAQLAPTIEPHLQVAGDLAWQVFANGEKIGESGNISTGEHTAGLAINYSALGLSDRGHPLLIAVRMTFTPEVNGAQPLPDVALGDAGLLTSTYWKQVYERTQSQWLTWACYALIGSAGLFFLALYWFDRTQRYLLWIGLTWLSLADLRINEFMVAASVHYSSRVEFFLYAIGQNVEVFVILFFFALNKRRVPIFYRICVVINFYYWAALVVAAFLPVRMSVMLRFYTEINFWMNSLQIVATLASVTCVTVAFWPLRSLRGLQIPLAVVCHLWMAMDFAYMTVQLPSLSFDVLTAFLKIQPYRSLAIAIVVVAMTLLLVQRLRTTNRERAALAGEMEAAREIQRLLVPAALDSNSSWSIDSAYLPAREVGGDFYRFRELPGGVQRVLLGDVSGKGAAAAMTAAMLLGASEGHEQSSPGQLLSHLNSVLSASQVGGFATCFCVDLAPDGSATLANAGHLAPYLNGEEVKLASGLPVGVTARADYAETRIRLAVGDRLTLLSDGVVEARDANGELFGFERTQAISGNSADQIAKTAELFGQEDDITVLTLTLSHAAVAHA
jgi:Stage II sporulation protein E (SpoIIE)